MTARPGVTATLILGCIVSDPVASAKRRGRAATASSPGSVSQTWWAAAECVVVESLEAEPQETLQPRWL